VLVGREQTLDKFMTSEDVTLLPKGQKGGMTAFVEKRKPTYVAE